MNLLETELQMTISSLRCRWLRRGLLKQASGSL
jgi:hypothetical protein